MSTGAGARRTNILADARQVLARLERGPASVADLADASGLGLRQAYRVVRSLEASGWPVERQLGEAPAGGGRRPVLYRVKRRRR